ncbi:MAG: hypothetical protein NZ925_03295 [Sulfolobales archaeon]|nr:hypothetical protein [Sulfolobales archaeon]MCX8208467.1 hypothetical protein [Sulfolobales archaeon]
MLINGVKVFARTSGFTGVDLLKIAIYTINSVKGVCVAELTECEVLAAHQL